jgi:hypothetical protein
MDLPDYTLLVLPTASGIIATVGGVMLTVREPNYRAVRAAFWIAAFCFAALGVVWGVTSTSQSMALRLIVAGATAAAGAMALTWALSFITAEKKDPPSVFMECNYGTIPKTFPASGRYYFSDIYPSITEEFVQLAIGYMFGAPGNQTWPDGKPMWAFECKLTNYGSLPVFNVVVPVRLTFQEAVRPAGQTNGWQNGRTVAVKSSSVTIAKIGPGKDNLFILYMKSQNPNFVRLDFSPEIVLQEGGDPIQKKGHLILPTYSHLDFTPVHFGENSQ